MRRRPRRPPPHCARSGAEQRQRGFQPRWRAGGDQPRAERERHARPATAAGSAGGGGRRTRRDSHVGGRVGAEGYDLGAARNARHHQALLGAGHHRAARGAEQRGLFVGNFFQTAQPFAVLDVDVEHGGDVGLHDSRETHNFTARVGTAFQHGGAMALAEREDRHRHADQVVEVSRRRQRFAEERTHHRGAKLLGAGFADRAADRDAGERTRRARAPQVMARQIAKRGERVVDFHRGDSGKPRCARRDGGRVRLARPPRRTVPHRPGRHGRRDRPREAPRKGSLR